MSSLERILGFYVDSLWKEGERYARIKSLSVVLQAARGIRKVTQVYFFAFLSCMVFTASVFSLLVYGVMSYRMEAQMPLDAVSGILVLSAIVSLGGVLLFLREKSGLNALGVQERIAEIATKSRSESHEMISPDLVHLMEKMLDEKLSQHAENRPLH